MGGSGSFDNVRASGSIDFGVDPLKLKREIANELRRRGNVTAARAIGSCGMRILPAGVRVVCGFGCCPTCSPITEGARRKRIQAAIRRLRTKHPIHCVAHVVLGDDGLGADLAFAKEVLGRLRERAVWANNIDGCISKMEWTPRANGSLHFHVHLLLDTTRGPELIAELDAALGELSGARMSLSTEAYKERVRDPGAMATYLSKSPIAPTRSPRDTARHASAVADAQTRLTTVARHAATIIEVTIRKRLVTFTGTANQRCGSARSVRVPLVVWWIPPTYPPRPPDARGPRSRRRFREEVLPEGLVPAHPGARRAGYVNDHGVRA